MEADRVPERGLKLGLGVPEVNPEQFGREPEDLRRRQDWRRRGGRLCLDAVSLVSQKKKVACMERRKEVLGEKGS